MNATETLFVFKMLLEGSLIAGKIVRTNNYFFLRFYLCVILLDFTLLKKLDKFTVFLFSDLLKSIFFINEHELLFLLIKLTNKHELII